MRAASVCHRIMQRLAPGRISRPRKLTNSRHPQLTSASRHDDAALSLQPGIAAAQKEAAERAPRFYLPPPLPRGLGSTVVLDGQEGGHAVRVLRLKEGDAVQLCDGQGQLLLCHIIATDKNSATLEAVDPVQQVPWQGPRWTLAAGCMTLKGGRTDWLVEKATELGAHTFLPIVTERSQPVWKNKYKKTSKKMVGGWVEEGEGGRLERLAVAASKQCLRAHMLRLSPPATIEQLLEQVAGAQVALVAAAGGGPVVRVLQGLYAEGRLVPWGQGELHRMLVVGPEGDFTPEELNALVEAGAIPVGLGSNRLRTETAALSLLATASMVDDGAAAGAAVGGL